MSVSRNRDHGQGVARAVPLISVASVAMNEQQQQKQHSEQQQKQQLTDHSMHVNHSELLTFLKSNYKYKRRCRRTSGVELPVEATDGNEGVAPATVATIIDSDIAIDCITEQTTMKKKKKEMKEQKQMMMEKRMTKSDKFSILKLINLSFVVVFIVANFMSRLMALLLLFILSWPMRQQQQQEQEKKPHHANRSRAVVAVGRVGDRNHDDGDGDGDDVVDMDDDVDGDEVDDSDVNDDSDETSCQRNHDKLSTLGSQSQTQPLQPQPRRRRPSPQWRRRHRHAWLRHRWIRALLPSSLASWSTLSSSSSSPTLTNTPSPSLSSEADNHIQVLPIFMTLFIAMALSVHSAEGGACWQKTLSNGKCSEIFSLNITKDECCAAGQDFSFTERELTSVEYFFATALGGGMECTPCMESCRGVNCGPNKRCAKRKGRPKCICAPECGAATRKRQRGRFFKGSQAPDHLEAAVVFGKSARDTRSLSSEIQSQSLGGDHEAWRGGRGSAAAAGAETEAEGDHRRGGGSVNSSQRQKVIVIQGGHPGGGGGRLRGHRMGGAKGDRVQMPGKRESPAVVERRLMIVQTRGEHEEKPTTRRLQVISNVNHNNNNNQNNNNRNNNKQNNNNQNNNNQNNNNQNNNNNNHKRRKVEKMQKQKPNKKSSSSQEERERGGSEREEQEKEVDEKNVEKDESSRGFAVATTITTTTNTTRETQSMSRHKQNTNHSNNNNNNNNNNMQQTKNFDTNNNNHNNYSSNNDNNNNSKLRHIHQSSRQLENTSNHDQQQQQQQQLQQHHGRHHQFRKRKKKLHNKPKDQQQQQQQEQHHVQTDIVQTNGNGGFNNATTTTTTKMTTVTMSGSGSGSSTATTTTLDSTRANSATSGEEPHSLNRGSDFATSSSSSSSSSSGAAATTTTSSSSSLMSGGVRSSPGRGESSDVVAGIDGVDPGSDVGAADDVEVGRSNSRSYVNSDDLAFDDRIYDKFNLHGIPSQQQGVTHFEKIHSSHHPVCGTDGRTYNTECQLKKRACRTDNADLVVAYLGHCRTSCSGVKCLNGLTCVEDQYTIPNCIACQIACPLDDRHEAEGLAVDESRAVCGVDGQTYRSVCAINRMICRIGRSIGVAYPGPCRDDRVTCADINCGPKRTCLMDLLTHEPRCVSCRYKCSRKRRPGAVRYEEGRICGVNNRTYNSWCEMRKDSCSTGFFIDVKSLGDCQ